MERVAALSLVPYLTNTTVFLPDINRALLSCLHIDHKTVNHAVVARSRCCRGKQAEYVDGKQFVDMINGKVSSLC